MTPRTTSTEAVLSSNPPARVLKLFKLLKRRGTRVRWPCESGAIAREQQEDDERRLERGIATSGASASGAGTASAAAFLPRIGGAHRGGTPCKLNPGPRRLIPQYFHRCSPINQR
jgi:hypothetical protein